jgi:hypothetical protein
VLPSGGVRGGRPGARLSYLSAFVAWPVTMQGNHGYGGLVSDSGEGARVKATTSKDGSRRENYPILILLGGSDKK